VVKSEYLPSSEASCGADRVAYLMDTIYKGYPFGTLLFWRTREKLRIERSLGPFDLPAPREDYPVDYVLDGQQRVTAIFGVFQTELQLARPEMWRDIYFDYAADQTAQESQFVALLKADVDPTRHFPLRVLFDTAEYRKATTAFPDELAKKIDDMQARFKEAKIPVQIFRTEDKATVQSFLNALTVREFPLTRSSCSPLGRGVKNFSCKSNRMLGGQAPSEYRRRMPDEVDDILRRALCPSSLFEDTFETFAIERALVLADVANVLCEAAG